MDILIAILDFVILVTGKTLGGILEFVVIMIVGCFLLLLSCEAYKVVGGCITVLLRKFKRIYEAL